jgi:hypothetical protein
MSKIANSPMLMTPFDLHAVPFTRYLIPIVPIVPIVIAALRAWH